MNPSALYRIEKRLAAVETVQSWTWTWAQSRGVYGPQFLTQNTLRIWRLWRVFST